MPNGSNKNLHRLQVASAGYRQRYGEWPSQARMHPTILHDIATTLDAERFAKLGMLLQLRTRDDLSISVGGRGVIEYADLEYERLDQAIMELAGDWLGIEPRRA